MDALPELPHEVRDGDERTVLVAMLDYYRTVFARKAWGLTPEQLDHRAAKSALTLGGLLKHMALVEHSWFWVRFSGQPQGEPWASAPFDDDWDWDFHSAPADPPAVLFQLWETEVAMARRIVADAPSLDTLAPQPSPKGPFNLRWILVHMIEEYARHCGHADLIREDIDGHTGD